MGYAKERGKLEKLITKITSINTYDEKNLAVLVDAHENYSHTVRILKNKEPETFIGLYNNELQQVKACKIAVKESDSDEDRLEKLMNYKATILTALANTIEVSKTTL